MRRSIVSLGLAVALSTGSSLAAAADSLPARKAGLWESKNASADGAHSTVRQCIDAATDQQMQGLSDKMGMDCSKKQLTKTATGYLSETSCKMGTISVEGKAVMTGDFNASVRIETDSVMTGLPGVTGPKASHTVIESRWLGPCEAGQKPGDIILESGKTVKLPAMPR
ncbi:DUF3617 domain-containing protein [Methylobacterium brachythecii]|uniref:DUF3617 family protein n=1 Tax=Methylobacterium brachythecii TaxID=1176177 RepID=A0A7W6AHQ8_9HYPH|nr:DUF3617 family protein [Methylobacterium brachythecii]MBB3903565.1 hypothetical protein [Methylobacterium brachythecii]GLS44083.1 hypothetical protein GCM10007884_20700 [Methylobacterium brachythecii]